MMKVLMVTERTKKKMMDEIGEEVSGRLDDAGADVDPEDRDFVIQAISEVVIGEAEIEDGGPGSLERLANEIASSIVREIRQRSDNVDWLGDLVIYNRMLNGEEKDTPQQIIDRVSNTVRWLGKKVFA
jgi:hypothetical protein